MTKTHDGGGKADIAMPRASAPTLMSARPPLMALRLVVSSLSRYNRFFCQQGGLMNRPQIFGKRLTAGMDTAAIDTATVSNDAVTCNEIICDEVTCDVARPDVVVQPGSEVHSAMATASRGDAIDGTFRQVAADYATIVSQLSLLHGYSETPASMRPVAGAAAGIATADMAILSTPDCAAGRPGSKINELEPDIAFRSDN